MQVLVSLKLLLVDMGEVVGEEDLGEVATEKVEEVRGCVHYKRGCKLVSPCCGKVYSCRCCWVLGKAIAMHPKV